MQHSFALEPVGGIRKPFVSGDRDELKMFVKRQIAEAQTKGVQIEWFEDPATILSVDRGGMALYGAYDPELSHAMGHYGFLLRTGPVVVATFAVAIYQLGNLDLGQYLREIGLFEGAPDVEIKDEALALASGIRGIVAFPGNAWVRHDRRKSELSRWFMAWAGATARAVSWGCFGADQSFLMMRDRLVQSGVDSKAQIRMPGVWWNGEMRWLAYSGPEFIRRGLAHGVPALVR